MAIKFKEGVVLYPDTIFRYEFGIMAYIAQATAPKGYDVTITSGCDGKHVRNSAHYEGWAIDIRIRDYPKDLKTWARRISNKLGSRYYVGLHPEDKPTHLHLNFLN